MEAHCNEPPKRAQELFDKKKAPKICSFYALLWFLSSRVVAFNSSKHVEALLNLGFWL